MVLNRFALRSMSEIILAFHFIIVLFFVVGFAAAGVFPGLSFCTGLVNLWSEVTKKPSVNIGSWGSAKYILVAFAIVISPFLVSKPF